MSALGAFEGIRVVETEKVASHLNLHSRQLKYYRLSTLMYQQFALKGGSLKIKLSGLKVCQNVCIL